MSITDHFTAKQLMRRPARTTALMLLSILLSLSIMGGTLIISGLKSGLDSLESRLGADIMVVPYEVRTKTNLNAADFDFNRASFGIAKSDLSKLYKIEGNGVQSTQAYKSGLSFKGKPIEFRLFDKWGLPISDEDRYVPFFRERCETCGMRQSCNGCSNCGKCEKTDVLPQKNTF